MNKKQKKTLLRIIISAFLLAAIWSFTSYFEINGYVKMTLILVPYFIIGYDVLIKAVRGILNRQPFDENFLMAVATVGAMCLSDFYEGVAVMLFYQIGELFQSVAVGKSRKNIAELMDIRPDYANVNVNNELKQVSPESIEIGTEIIVNPGEKVPIDGVITSGITSLNLSALTGESLPKEVAVGDEILSGSINLSGVISVKTTKNFGESTVSKILDLVENSSMKKSRSENFITRFAKYYTPIVCYLALALGILPPIVRLMLGQAPLWSEWIVRALTFLVISCPCALVISIPLSFFGGIGCASKNGILVKGSNYLEALSQAKYFVFDKTGTLTKGVFEVTEIQCFNEFTKDDVLMYAAYAESASSHPIAKSIMSAFGGKIDSKNVENITEIAGNGVSAKVLLKEVLVGNRKLMQSVGIEVDDKNTASTVCYVCVDKTLAGCIFISDVVKSTTKEAIKTLKNSGINKTVMLTGDNQKVAEKVAEEIGIDIVKSELLPSDKVREVEKLIKEKGKNEKLCFVGDGINDAPVLSLADIGIAMGALGSDAAIEAADVVLMDDNPQKISLGLKISKCTLKIVKQNITFALAVKLVCLILGAIGIANMWLAIFADVGVMVIAVLNAVRTLKIK